MDIKDIKEFYSYSPSFIQYKKWTDDKEKLHVFLQGLKGSHASILACLSVIKHPQRHHVLVFHDREEAAYFQYDLKQLFEKERAVLLFPFSYKKPYQFYEIDNANVLERAEVLNDVNKRDEGSIICTYPDALSEKVINKRSLVKNTLGIKKGEPIQLQDLVASLTAYGFEKNDFVYEAGDFSIRGGIIDIFSFSDDLPFRIELLGKKVESIRTFNPENQLSEEERDYIAIIPDIQTKLVQEQRESFFTYMPDDTFFWFKDIRHCREVIDNYFLKGEENLSMIREHSGNPDMISSVADLFIDGRTFFNQMKTSYTVEFGSSAVLSKDHFISFTDKLQPSYNKNYDLFVEDLAEYQSKGFQLVICGESSRQTEKIKYIIEERNPAIQVETLPMAFQAGFVDINEKILFYTDHQLLERYHRYQRKTRFSKTKTLTIKELKELHPGDFVTHIDYGIGRFAGLERREKNGKMQELVRLIYRDDDVLYVNVHALHKISKYSGKDGQIPSVSKLGSQEWEKKKSKVKKRVKELAFDLIELYAKRMSAKGFAYAPDNYMQIELESNFLYEDTPDQAKATNDVKADMEKPNPMDRLVCGDVGFGKTEVAIRAAFKAVCDNQQVAILVPTTILAMQHYKTFADRLSDFPCNVEYINRFRSAADVKKIKEGLKDGTVDIVIGTHKLVNKSVKFKNLGLLIIDEEQKFGVAVKDKIKNLKHDIDVLTLTATPIPRTLQFSLMGARDLSVIATPPPNRQPVATELLSFNEEVIRDAISHEVKRGGQVFFVHNRVKDIESVGDLILKLVPDVSVGVAHGQMDGKALENVMVKFINQEFDVLVSTNIIEAGLDIPNANTIIINNAQMYGLSDLHQMRGRVGRSNKKAFCYLLIPQLTGVSSDALKRLKTLEEFSDLGDGFKIAMRDLDIRGAGNMLGGEQSGFISDIGYETYQKILEEAIQELKETSFKELFKQEIDLKGFKRDCNIETDLEVLIPEDYVSNISERLRLYNRLDNTKTARELHHFAEEIKDRFGPIPSEVEELMSTVRLRWKAERLGFERLVIKNESMKCYVSTEQNDSYFQSDVFGGILSYIQEHPKKANLKELNGKLLLSFKKIYEIEDAIVLLEEITNVAV